MRSERLILVLSLLAFRDVASSTTTLSTEYYTTPLERTVNINIPTQYLDFKDTCHLVTPDNQDLDMSDFDYAGVIDHSNLMHPCQIAIFVTENMAGSWLLYAKSGDADNPYVVELPFVIHIEGLTDESETTTTEFPEGTTTEQDEIIIDQQETTVPSQEEQKFLESIIFQANIDDPVQVRTDRTNLNAVTDSCQLITPSGEVIELYKDLEYPGLVVEEPNMMSSCLIKLTASEDAHGNWKLIAREYSGNVIIEVEQPFQIHVTETVSMFPEGLVAVEPGKDLYIRISKSLPELSSCELVAPESLVTDSRRDDRYPDTCAYVVSGVSENHSGSWLVLAEGRISYKAQITVVVEEADIAATRESLALVEGEPVSLVLEPQHALYCQLRDPRGAVVFSGFSACRLEVAAVERSHAGEWSMLVGVPGALTPVEKRLDVTVSESVVLNALSSRVDREGNSAALTCGTVAETDDARCKFVRPDSAVFVAQAGVGEGRYSYFGQGITPTDSGHYRVECGLFVEGIEDVDVGSWRCVLETGGDVLSGFLRVGAASGGELAALEGNEVSTEVLESSGAAVRLAGQEAVLSCSMEAQIQYCWLRAPNGTVISLAPGVSTANYEYSGSGLGLGECGIRIYRTHPSDSGTWSCNVGTELSADLGAHINLTVYESPMLVMHGTVRAGKYSTALVILGMTYDRSPVDYCRFVTPAGYGFHSNSANLPARYQVERTDLSTGYCRVRIIDPTWSDHGSWTVAARLASGVEAVASTHPVNVWGQVNFSQLMMWYLLPILLLLTCLVISMMFSTKKSRRWTATRASAVRSSVRSIRSSIWGKRPSGSPPTYDAAMENNANTANHGEGSSNDTAINMEPSNETVSNNLIVVSNNEINNEETLAINRDSDANEQRR